MGTPRVIAGSSQQIVWRWDSDPFGEARADQDPDGDGVAFAFGLRFPGQWFDGETGLHYNYFRDYQFKTGRYLESDPTGLDGGLNTYAYAQGNAIRFKDPTGQAVIALPWIAVCLADPPCAALLAAGLYVAAKALAEALIKAAELAKDIADDIADSLDRVGDCSKSYHRYLQNLVNALCKPNPGKCNPGEACDVMNAKLAAHTACANARKNIMDICFRGGDRGHQIEYTTRRQMAETCRGLLPTCCPVGACCP